MSWFYAIRRSPQNRSTIPPLFIGPYAAANNTALFSMKALARYKVILLGEQRHIRCEQLAQGCCPNNAVVGVEPATSWSRVQRPTATPPSHLKPQVVLSYRCMMLATFSSLCLLVPAVNCSITFHHFPGCYYCVVLPAGYLLQAELHELNDEYTTNWQADSLMAVKM